jgi:hypothetical protein
MAEGFEFEKLDHRLIRGLYHLKTEESSYMKPRTSIKKVGETKFMSGLNIEKDAFSKKSIMELVKEERNRKQHLATSDTKKQESQFESSRQNSSYRSSNSEELIKKKVEGRAHSKTLKESVSVRPSLIQP